MTGLLAEPNDAPDLAGKIRWAIEHAGEMQDMGSSARQGYEALYRGPSHLTGLLQAYSAVLPVSERAPEGRDP